MRRVTRKPGTQDGNSAKQDAVGEVFRSYNSTLIRYLTLRTRSSHEAAEIAQEAYLKVLTRSDSEQIIDLEAYLFFVAKNIHIDRVRSRARGEAAIHRSGTEMAYIGIRDEVDIVRPEDQIAAKEMIHSMLKALDELSPKCKSAFLMYKFEAKEYAEIAEHLQVSESMVRKYVIRSLQHLGRCLQGGDEHVRDGKEPL